MGCSASVAAVTEGQLQPPLSSSEEPLSIISVDPPETLTEDCRDKPFTRDKPLSGTTTATSRKPPSFALPVGEVAEAGSPPPSSPLLVMMVCRENQNSALERNHGTHRSGDLGTMINIGSSNARGSVTSISRRPVSPGADMGMGSMCDTLSRVGHSGTHMSECDGVGDDWNSATSLCSDAVHRPAAFMSSFASSGVLSTGGVPPSTGSIVRMQLPHFECPEAPRFWPAWVGVSRRGMQRNTPLSRHAPPDQQGNPLELSPVAGSPDNAAFYSAPMSASSSLQLRSTRDKGCTNASSAVWSLHSGEAPADSAPETRFQRVAPLRSSRGGNHPFSTAGVWKSLVGFASNPPTRGALLADDEASPHTGSLKSFVHGTTSQHSTDSVPF